MNSVNKVIEFLKENPEKFDIVKILPTGRNAHKFLEVELSTVHGTPSSNYSSVHTRVTDSPIVVKCYGRDRRMPEKPLDSWQNQFVGQEIVVANYNMVKGPEVFLIQKEFLAGYQYPNQPVLRTAIVVCHHRDERAVWLRLREGLHGRGWLVTNPTKEKHVLVNVDSWWVSSKSYFPMNEDHFLLSSNRAATLERELDALQQPPDDLDHQHTEDGPVLSAEVLKKF